MAGEPKPKAARKKKRRRPLRDDFIAYVIEITGWDWGYSLSLNEEKHPVDPYREYRHLQITGMLLRPAGLKTDRVEVTLLPSASMSEERRKDYEPLALGSLEQYPDRIAAALGIPADALPPILQMLSAKQCKFILLTGSRFRYRSARLRGFRLEMELTEDDMPASDATA